MREAGNRRRLAETHFGRRGTEIELRRGADTDRRLTKLDAVEILLEDLLLAEMMLQTKRPEYLSNFSAPASRRRLHQSRKLHRYRGRPRHHLARSHIVLRRARDRAEIDSPMLPESTVFDGDERVDEIDINLLVRHPLRVTAVRGACGAKRHAIAILDRHSLLAGGVRDDAQGQRRRDPRRHSTNGARDDKNAYN